MLATKTLAVIGASEETVAHIRLLMKLGAKQLHHLWRWGSEESADFVAVEVHDLGAQGVLARCQAAGVPCALMAEANEVVVQGMVLRRPFKLEQIVAVLNAAGAATADAGAVEAFADDFYTRDMDDHDVPTGRTDSDDVWGERESARASPRRGSAVAASDLDFLIHGDPLIEPAAPKPLIKSDTVLEAGSHEQTLRSASRADQSRHRIVPAGEVPSGLLGVASIDVPPIAMPARNETGAPLSPNQTRADAGESSGHRLSEYLEGDLLGSPSQLQLPALDGHPMPILTLDPKKRAYHADADLAALEAYARLPLPRSAVKGVSTTDLARVRETQAARTYDELRWLIALLKSGGRLASRLDPGGTFHVSAQVRIDPLFHAHGAISAALAKPARLHELTATSGASMEQVFDVVNAYDAIGRLSWTPRQRLAAEPQTETKPAAGGRFWPFGKR